MNFFIYLYQKLSNQLENNDQQHQQELITNLQKYRKIQKNFITIPYYIEKYCFCWAAIIFSNTLNTLLCLPFNLIYINHKIYYKLIITILPFLILCLPIFNIQVWYHLFRGQSTLKLYGLMFAIQIMDKLLTLGGSYVFLTLWTKIQARGNLFNQITGVTVYVFLHSIVHLLQFSIYTVVLASQINVMVIYVFVINLTKMKSTAFKKFDEKNYKNQLNFDAKQRFQKFWYLVVLSLIPGKQIEFFFLKVCIIWFVNMIIEWTKHLSVVFLSGIKLQFKNLPNQLISLIFEEDYDNQNQLMTLRFPNRLERACFYLNYNIYPFLIFMSKLIYQVLIKQFSVRYVAIVLMLHYLIVEIFLYNSRKKLRKHQLTLIKSK